MVTKQILSITPTTKINNFSSHRTAKPIVQRSEIKTPRTVKEIGNKIQRGTTSLYAKGMYKQEEKSMLLCVASRGEVRDIMKIVNNIDKNAFVVISNAREVFGKGFKENE